MPAWLVSLFLLHAAKQMVNNKDTEAKIDKGLGILNLKFVFMFFIDCMVEEQPLALKV